MSLHFIKMQGAGNDFILFDNRNGYLTEKSVSELAPAICDRKFGVGSDGLITLQEDIAENSNLLMIYKNPDGSDAGMCGNGARCFAAFAKWLGYGDIFHFRVHNSIYKAECKGNRVAIDFPLRTKVRRITLEGNEALNIYTNTEHIVCPLSTSEPLGNEELLISDGRRYRYHDMFEPEGTNVNFIHGKSENELHLQTYERGVEDLTLACGTGAIASAIGWHNLQKGKTGVFSYTVKTKGGTLKVFFTFEEKTEEYSNIQLEGPATFVFEGDYYI